MLDSNSELCVFKLVHMHVTHWGTNLNTWWSVLGSPDGPGWSEVGGTGLVHVLYVYIQLYMVSVCTTFLSTYSVSSRPDMDDSSRS